jgi:hypothetical protein
MPNSKAREYRDKAKDCEERAANSRDNIIKVQPLELADEWRRMAAEEGERK